MEKVWRWRRFGEGRRLVEEVRNGGRWQGSGMNVEGRADAKKSECRAGWLSIFISLAVPWSVTL